jgi:hypothetical protein
MRKFEKLATEALEIYLQHSDESDEKALLERKMTNFLITEADKPNITAVATKLGQEIKDMLTRLPKGMNNTRGAATKILTELGKIAMTGSDDKEDVKNAAKLVTDASAVMSKFLNAITKIMAPLELVLEKEKVDNVTFDKILNGTDPKYTALKAKLPGVDAFKAAIDKAFKPPVGFMRRLKNMVFGEDTSFKLTDDQFYEDLMGSKIGELRKFVDPSVAGDTMKALVAAPEAVTPSAPGGTSGGGPAPAGGAGGASGGSSNKLSDYDFGSELDNTKNLIAFIKHAGFNPKDKNKAVGDLKNKLGAADEAAAVAALKKLQDDIKALKGLRSLRSLKLEGAKRDEGSLILERWSKLAGLDE